MGGSRTIQFWAVKPALEKQISDNADVAGPLSTKSFVIPSY